MIYKNIKQHSGQIVMTLSSLQSFSASRVCFLIDKENSILKSATLSNFTVLLHNAVFINQFLATLDNVFPKKKDKIYFTSVE